jgi:hypothetical protein
MFVSRGYRQANMDSIFTLQETCVAKDVKAHVRTGTLARPARTVIGHGLEKPANGIQVISVMWNSEVIRPLTRIC